MAPKLTLNAVNALAKPAFVAAFGGIFEHSPWVAETAHSKGPFPTVTALHAVMCTIVKGADTERQRQLLCAHPDLAGRAARAGDVTADSKLEQATAGLDQLTENELKQFLAINQRYRERFGFPFIMAVRNANKRRILAAYARRVERDSAVEFAGALQEVNKIAWMRLLDLVVHAGTGRLTTHVLDTALGCPAGGLWIDLYFLSQETSAPMHFQTNSDGRLDGPALAGQALQAGEYLLEFHAGDYFAAQGHDVTAPAFLNRVPLRFAIANPEHHYHVPLLLSPWAYSTYRGS